jgi:hypothetical protein
MPPYLIPVRGAESDVLEAVERKLHRKIVAGDECKKARNHVRAYSSCRRIDNQ